MSLALVLLNNPSSNRSRRRVEKTLRASQKLGPRPPFLILLLSPNAAGSLKLVISLLSRCAIGVDRKFDGNTFNSDYRQEAS